MPEINAKQVAEVQEEPPAPPTPQQSPADPYRWTAIYTPEDVFHQYNPDGSENRYEDIDRKRLTGFQLYREGNLVYWLDLEPGQRLIFRRRVQKSSDGGQNVVTMVGWQQTVAGENVQSIAWILESGLVVNTGRFRENNAVFGAPVFLDIEKE